MPDDKWIYGLIEGVVVGRDGTIPPTMLRLGYAIDFDRIERNKLAALE